MRINQEPLKDFQLFIYNICLLLEFSSLILIHVYTPTPTIADRSPSITP